MCGRALHAGADHAGCMIQLSQCPPPKACTGALPSAITHPACSLPLAWSACRTALCPATTLTCLGGHLEPAVLHATSSARQAPSLAPLSRHSAFIALLTRPRPEGPLSMASSARKQPPEKEEGLRGTVRVLRSLGELEWAGATARSGWDNCSDRNSAPSSGRGALPLSAARRQRITPHSRRPAGLWPR